MIVPMVIGGSPALGVHHAAHPAIPWTNAAVVLVDNATITELDARLEAHLCRTYGPRVPDRHGGGIGMRFGWTPTARQLDTWRNQV